MAGTVSRTGAAGRTGAAARTGVAAATAATQARAVRTNPTLQKHWALMSVTQVELDSALVGHCKHGTGAIVVAFVVVGAGTGTAAMTGVGTAAPTKIEEGGTSANVHPAT
jgi:hypothetical protein